MPVREMLQRARAAIRLGDAATARRVLEAVDPVDAAAREALAQVCYLELDFPRLAGPGPARHGPRPRHPTHHGHHHAAAALADRDRRSAADHARRSRGASAARGSRTH
jgi:hypothetical protein